MQIKIQKTAKQDGNRKENQWLLQKHVSNSSLLSIMEAQRMDPSELESLPSQERRPTQELGAQIQARLGVSLPGIRIFEDAGLQEQYGQRAYARGNEIHVAKGEYAPNTQSGQELLLHEAGHIVQQGAGMARGTGILQNPALEAQADSGMQAPASFSMPTSPAGNPIQGWDKKWKNPFRRKKEEPEEIEMQDMADLPPEQTDAPLISAQAGQELLSGEVAPTRGQRFLRGLSTVGHYMALPFQKIGGGISGKAHAIQRQHQRAVDQLNNGRDDYEAMSGWERFKWSVKNPFARMSASHKIDDTRARNAHSRGIERMADTLRETKHYDQAIGDAAYDPAKDDYYGMHGLGKPGLLTEMSEKEMQMPGVDQTIGEKGLLAKGVFEKGALGGSVLAPGAGFFTKSAGGIRKAEQAVADAQAELDEATKAGSSLPVGDPNNPITQAQQKLNDARNALPLTAAEQGWGIASGAIGAFGSTASFVSNAMALADHAQKGNAADAAASGLTALGNAGSLGGNLAKISAYASGSTEAVKAVGGKAIPGIGIGVGGLQMIGGGVRVGSATATREKMKSRMQSMEERRAAGQLSPDEERMYRTFKQAKRMASVRQMEGSLDMVSGGLNVIGNGLTLGGVTAPVGAIVSGAGTAVGIAKGLASDKMKKARRTDVVEEELGLSSKIQELVDQGIDPRDAKHVVLKSMGFASGKRKEAFQHITMRRATDLHKRANAGDEEAQQIVSDLGLYRFGGEYSLQGISEKLGMDGGSAWQTQMSETAHSRDKNPFAAKAKENRAQIHQKQMERAMDGKTVDDKLAKLRRKAAARKEKQGMIY